MSFFKRNKLVGKFEVRSRYRMGFVDRFNYSFLVALGLYSFYRYAVWWFSIDHVPANWQNSLFPQLHYLDYALFGLLSFVVFTGLFLRVGTWFAVWFMREPELISPEEGLKVAFITCYVPGKEPLEMLKETLIAMKNADYPHDTWVLDEGDDETVKELCQELSVNHFSRKGIEAYNARHGYFRAKTKAGNLNSWRNQVEHYYDIVAQVDMDHTPQKNYLTRLLGYFRDPLVGFVGVPQVYKNIDNWIARGAAEQTHFFYGPLQQGFYGSHMPFLIGTTHVYRVRAMQSFGGYAPTIAEDYLTGIHFYSNGWKGVYAPEVVASGHGPTTWVDYFNQQMRWSYGLFEILFKHSYKHFFKITWRQKVNIFFSQLFYFSGLTMFFGFALTTVYLFFGLNSTNITFGEWIYFALPAYLTGQLIVIYLHPFYIDSKKQPSIGLLGMFLGQAANIIYTVAFFRFITGRKLTYKVTPKDPLNNPFSISKLKVFAPFMFIILVSFAGLLFSFSKNYDSWLMRFWAIHNIAILSAVIVSAPFANAFGVTKRFIWRIFFKRKSTLSTASSESDLTEEKIEVPRVIPKNRYKYIIKHAWHVRLIYILGILAWFGVAYGYFQFMQLNKLYAVLFFPFIAYFSVYFLISYFINLFYRGFSIPKHNFYVKEYWKKLVQDPSVDVFLPTCGEDLEILKNTFKAVSQIEYSNIKVFVLDDKGLPEVRELAQAMKFTYLTRPDKGHMKKAGNLKYGYEHSDGEFIVVFDADFSPDSDFIKELLPYMDDPQTAIVQSPQFFEMGKDVYKRSPLEYGAGHVQEDFYRVIQVSRDFFKAAICVGSNAIYRRKALDLIGGTAQIEHSEDVHTGFNLMTKGFRVKYIPLVLAIGLCPSDLHAYFNQQHRWCTGSMSLMFSKKFWTTKLSIFQKMCFMSGFLYYVSHTLDFLLPLPVFILLFFHFDSVSIANGLTFYPALIYSFIILPWFRINDHTQGTTLARIAYKYSYSHALFSKILGKHLSWKPTNKKMSNLSSEFHILAKWNALYFLLYVSLVSVTIALGKFPVFNFNYYSILFWIFYNVYIHFLFLYHSRETVEYDKRVNARSWKQYFVWKYATRSLYLGLIVMIVGSSIVYSIEDGNKNLTNRTNVSDIKQLAAKVNSRYDEVREKFLEVAVRNRLKDKSYYYTQRLISYRKTLQDSWNGLLN